MSLTLNIGWNGLLCSSLKRQIHLSCVLVLFIETLLSGYNSRFFYFDVKGLINHAHSILWWSKSELILSWLLCFSRNHGQILLSVISNYVVLQLTSIGKLAAARPKGKVNVSLRATNWTTVINDQNDLCWNFDWLTYRCNAFWYGPSSLWSFWNLHYTRGGTWKASTEFEFSAELLDCWNFWKSYHIQVARIDGLVYLCYAVCRFCSDSLLHHAIDYLCIEGLGAFLSSGFS